MPAVTGGSRVRAESAAARLYVEYRERIYRFCYGRLRSREEAEDAAQNVFMRVHMALDRGVVPEYEAAWLYKIAHNVCLSRIDSNSRRGAEELHAFDEDDVQIAAPEVDGDELAGLSEALEGMPHNLRTAILLREWQGLSYAEVAEAMGLSVSAVETLIFRARRHLAWALEHPGEKPKTPARRLLDLLGLGSLRSLFGAGSVAKLAAGAALLAVTGGGAAIAMTDAHSRPAPAAPAAHVPASAPAAQVMGRAVAKKTVVVASPTTNHQVRGTVSGRHQIQTSAPAVVASVQPSAPSTPTQVAASSPSTPAAAATPKPASPVAVAQPAAPPVPTASVPTVSTPSTPSTPDVPTVTAPTVSVPAVSVPAASVPAASVPTVSLPSVGGIAGK